MRLRIAWLILLCTLATTALAQGQHDNAPATGAADAWTSNFGYVVSDTFQPMQNLQFGVGEFSGDGIASYGSGAANSGGALTDEFISVNPYGHGMDKMVASELYPTASSESTYWLNLEIAGSPSGGPGYRGEDSGAGCKSSGCPSSSSDGAVDTIPSQAFTNEIPSAVPEPSSILLFGVGVLAVAGVLRYRKRH